MPAQPGTRVVGMNLCVHVRRLVAPPLTLEAAPGARHHPSVVGGVVSLEALGVAVEAVRRVEAAARGVARGVALAVAHKRRHAAVRTWMLSLVEAVATIPVAARVEARLVAVAIADP